MPILLPIENKVELALIAYLWTYGGTIAPALLAQEAGYFDNPAYFAPNPLGTGTVFDGAVWYPGHCSVDMLELPRIVVACARGSGDGAYAGYDQLPVDVLQVSKFDDDIAHAKRHAALRAILRQDICPAMQDLLNKPAGMDARAVQGFGLDSLKFLDQEEGRSKGGDEAPKHGTKLMLEVTAHLEAS